MLLPLPDHVTVTEQARLLDLSPTRTLQLIRQCNIKLVRRGTGPHAQMEIPEQHALALLRCHLKYDWDMTLKTLKLPPRAFPLPVKPYHYEKYSKLLALIWRRRHAKTLITCMTLLKPPSATPTSSSTSWRRKRRSKNNANSLNSHSVGRSTSTQQ